jgi:hypothetical protein
VYFKFVNMITGVLASYNIRLLEVKLK